jgi:hypothetical protein
VVQHGEPPPSEAKICYWKTQVSMQIETVTDMMVGSYGTHRCGIDDFIDAPSFIYRFKLSPLMLLTTSSSSMDGSKTTAEQSGSVP